MNRTRWRFAVDAIGLVNRKPTQAISCVMKLGECARNRRIRAMQRSGDSPDAFNDIEHPNRVTPQPVKLQFVNGMTRLPPHSLTSLKRPRQLKCQKDRA